MTAIALGCEFHARRSLRNYYRHVNSSDGLVRLNASP
jgi:hypothetical protein